MAAKVSIDQAGRILIPKEVRKKWRLQAGDELEIDIEDTALHLRLVQPAATIQKELGVWVFHSEPLEQANFDVVEENRLARIEELLK